MRHVTHPEAKAAGHDGMPCGPASKGELSRLQVQIDRAVHIGKESHELEEVQAGLIASESTYVHYIDGKQMWAVALSRLKKIPTAILVKRSELT